MKVVVSGASGFLGTALRRALEADGDEVVALVRRQAKGNDVEWRPDDGLVDVEKLRGADAAVNLAGENIFGRWTETKKKEILESRREATLTLSTALAQLEPLPEVLISMSGVNYYGDRGDEELGEESGQGRGFLSEVCEEWERCTEPARAAGIRVVNARMGIVLDDDGGALKKMLQPFKLGLGGKLGSGDQFMSWVALDDAISAIKFALRTPALSGPVNFSAPNPVRNKDFTRALAKALGRPAFLTVPEFALRIVMGQAADELLLASMRVSKTKLQEAGFEFSYPELDGALRHVL
jgi:uncharacterized protein (TIGR01777 family)